MSTATLHTELISDPVLRTLLDGLERQLNDLRWFAVNPYESILKHTRQYTAWHRAVLKTPRTFARWIIPVWLNSTARLVSVDVYGKRPAPIVGLGEQPVSRFIRFLLYEQKLSDDQAAELLCYHLDYAYKSARPLIRRMRRDEARQKLVWKRERRDSETTSTFAKIIEEA